MDKTILIIVAMVCITIIYVAALIVFAKMGIEAFKKTQTGTAKSFGLLFNRAVRFLTVAVVILAVVILASLGSLTEGAVAILSGIAGFVLGGAGKDRENITGSGSAG